MTQGYILRLWKHYNRIYFNNELPIPSVRWLKDADCYGMITFIRGNQPILDINKVNNACDKTLRDTVKHEMIHALQYKERLPLTHGRQFKKESKRLDMVDIEW